jgi:hypothetical protein
LKEVLPAGVIDTKSFDDRFHRQWDNVPPRPSSRREHGYGSEFLPQELDGKCRITAAGSSRGYVRRWLIRAQMMGHRNLVRRSPSRKLSHALE